ncbi:carboxymuconolactone decarboxylase family protein [Hymenobacter sp. BT683]|uniref:Carboxymuconolactone decarboxylase family protein n=1 Tax=Hymenobacter jeongseonensis TaxID=2791027 RepID=A0ABS0IJV4_9BACT|nr:carboxymuconolactone decarboxylase family protein [Hymenobacter jeongseonensis]MBF9238626.1 carboxymuconolactone decarboxylase family protein [Hymenobacter jeongseonensis]
MKNTNQWNWVAVRASRQARRDSHNLPLPPWQTPRAGKLGLLAFFVFLLGILAVAAPFPGSCEQAAADALTARQQAITTISALTAKGNLPELHQALGKGLEAGLTVNEEKEVLVHLYAYCGFPRSLQGINTLIKVLDERKAKGIKDVIGKEASPVTSTASKYERGKKNLEKLSGKPEPATKTGYAAFSPEIERFLKEHLFADIFERDVLTYQERELVTIAALVSLGGVEPMLQSHLGIGLHTGLTPAQLQQLMAVTETSIGKKEADAGRAVLAKALSTAQPSSAPNQK